MRGTVVKESKPSSNTSLYLPCLSLLKKGTAPPLKLMANWFLTGLDHTFKLENILFTNKIITWIIPSGMLKDVNPQDATISHE